MSRRDRVVLGDSGTSSWTQTGSSNPSRPTTRYSYLFTNYEETFSENHRWPPRNGSRFDVGGDFFSIKNRIVNYCPELLGINSNGINGGIFRGRMFPKTSAAGKGNILFPAAVYSTANQLNSYGTTAIARVLPTNPTFNAAQFVGELYSDGIPDIVGQQLIRERLRHIRSAGDEYLNVEFGWKPFISDIMNFAKTVKKTHKVLTQYKRDSDKLIRRRYQFPDITDTTSSTSISSATPALVSNMYDSGSGTLTKVSERTTRRWFSGAFRYHLPMGDDALSRMENHVQMANHLLGIIPTPETLWQLTPWSWAADWVSNTGDVIHNMTRFAQDGLVMPWGYMMENVVARDTYTLTGMKLKGSPSVPLTQVFTTEVKQRVHATPYGFGLNTSAFTSRQWAILAALGLSRSNGQLARG
jgi:hypothetical protein